MREIKFRAWSPSLESFCSAFSVHKNGYISSLIDAHIDKDSGVAISDAHWDENDLILSQYTGLKDKNGKDIYEGDVILGDQVVYFVTEDNARFDQTCIGGYGIQNGKHDLYYYKDYPDFEIIGNIYENPELINKNTSLLKWHLKEE